MTNCGRLGSISATRSPLLDAQRSQRRGKAVDLVQQLPVGQRAAQRDGAKVAEDRVEGGLVGILASAVLEQLMQRDAGVVDGRAGPLSRRMRQPGFFHGMSSCQVNETLRTRTG